MDKFKGNIRGGNIDDDKVVSITVEGYVYKDYIYLDIEGTRYQIFNCHPFMPNMIEKHTIISTADVFVILCDRISSLVFETCLMSKLSYRDRKKPILTFNDIDEFYKYCIFKKLGGPNNG